MYALAVSVARWWEWKPRHTKQRDPMEGVEPIDMELPADLELSDDEYEYESPHVGPSPTAGVASAALFFASGTAEETSWEQRGAAVVARARNHLIIVLRANPVHRRGRQPSRDGRRLRCVPVGSGPVGSIRGGGAELRICIRCVALITLLHLPLQPQAISQMLPSESSCAENDVCTYQLVQLSLRALQLPV